MSKTLNELDSLLAEFDKDPSTSSSHRNGSKQIDTGAEQPAPKPIVMCAKCGQKIVSEVTMALGKAWHSTCLSCDGCNNALNGDFFDYEGQNLCKNCIEAKVRCARCSKPITGEYLIGEGKMFHPTCLDTSTCATCQQTIQPTQSKVSALTRTYHTNCFQCTDCKKTLSNTFFNKNGLPYCDDCSKKGTPVQSVGNCVVCTKPIEPGSAFIRYESKIHHENCFACFSCKTVLDPNSFYNVNGKPACESCARKQ